MLIFFCFSSSSSSIFSSNNNDNENKEKEKNKYYILKNKKILSLITQCKKEGLITDDERKIMKEFIITKEPDLRVDLEEYAKDHDLRKLVETLKVMSGLTDMSSPADTGLMDLKRRKQQ